MRRCRSTISPKQLGELSKALTSKTDQLSVLEPCWSKAARSASSADLPPIETINLHLELWLSDRSVQRAQTFHEGVDFAAETGNRDHRSRQRQSDLCRYRPAYGRRLVEIDHGNGLVTPTPTALSCWSGGDLVVRGQRISRVGSTGPLPPDRICTSKCASMAYRRVARASSPSGQLHRRTGIARMLAKPVGAKIHCNPLARQALASCPRPADYRPSAVRLRVRAPYHIMIDKFHKNDFRQPHGPSVKELPRQVQKINALEDGLRIPVRRRVAGKTAAEFKQRIANGETLDGCCPEAFAVLCARQHRVLAMRHFDVQLIGGMALPSGQDCRNATGEGKTLMATLPVYLNALAGKGVMW